MRGALESGHAQFLSVEVRLAARGFSILGRVPGDPKANDLAAGERENFFLSFELVEGNGKQMAVGQVAQASCQRPTGCAGTENKCTRCGREEGLEKAKSQNMIDMSVAQKNIGRGRGGAPLQSSLPSGMIPVPASKIKRRPSTSTSTQEVLPPTARVAGSTVG